MSSDSGSIHITLQLGADVDPDPEHLDSLTRQLRTEMIDANIGSPELIREGPGPEGAKVAEAFTIGALAIAVLPAVLPKLIDVLRDWSERGQNRSVKIKTTVGNRSVEVDYSPETMSQAELKGLVKSLTDTLSADKRSK